jgi:hypothetical protein
MMCRSVGAQNARAAALVDRQLSVDPKQVVCLSFLVTD